MMWLKDENFSIPIPKELEIKNTWGSYLPF